MTDAKTQIIFLVIGWALGLLSPIIVNFINRRRKAREICAALKIELHEIQYRLAIISFQLQQKTGELDKEFLEWSLKIISKYSGINSSENIKNLISKFNEIPEDQISLILKKEKISDKTGLTLKKIYAPTLESNISSISILNKKIQSSLIDIKINIDMINEDINQSHYYVGLTFDGNISPKNYKNAKSNLFDIYRLVSKRAMNIATQIGEIQWP